MAELGNQFDVFLSNIEPDTEVIGYAQDAHIPVRDYLKNDPIFKDFFVESFLYGSYKRHTAVGTIKDIDIVVLTKFDPENPDDNPRSVLRKLKAALARYYDDPENPQYQRRSIRIDEPLPDVPETEMTLDIIPAVEISGSDNPLKVPDRELNSWIWSHPKGHLKYSSELNDEEHGNGKYIPAVKMMKWWWKYQCMIRQPDVERPKPKGFWIECLTAENFDASQEGWADIFIGILQGISDKYFDHTAVPLLQDPGLPDETIKTNITLDEFEVFMTAVNDCLDLSESAKNEADALKSSEMWQDIFGEEFPLYDEDETLESREVAKSIVVDSYSHAQIAPWPPIARKSHFNVRINAYIFLGGTTKSGGINSDGRILPNGASLKYIARTNTPQPYDVYWQVVNTGAHAHKEDGLRGGFFKAKLSNGSPSTNPLINWERTSYTGKHWIECFIVKNDVCVARSGKFFVNIKNPSYP